MAKLVAAILILIHIHHSTVMIAGDLMQVKVVAAAIKAGIPLFDHHGPAGPESGSGETLEMDDADFCALNHLVIEPRPQLTSLPSLYCESPHSGVRPVHSEILTPPPQG